jgi:tRNA nucleotidyltransferase (CCA-adding enzyme)
MKFEREGIANERRDYAYMEAGLKGQLGRDYMDLEEHEIHRGYEMGLPEEVMDFCRAVDELGGKALVVGGCGRDMVMAHEEGKKVSPKDIDIEVYGITPDDLLGLVDGFFGLEEAGTFGKKFEIIKVFGRNGKLEMDISIPRSDNKTGIGSKGFETTSHPEFSIREAALRRDLTCNSISYDPLEKLVYDPFGGIKDIKNKVLKATDPEKFAEDPVRILRVMQFLARFEATADPGTFELCKRILDSGELDKEQRKRMSDEFRKMFLKGKRPSLGLRFAMEVGLIDRYFPSISQLARTPQDGKHHEEGDVWEHTCQVVDAAAEIAERENLSDDDRLALMYGAFGHDFGKVTHTQIDEKTGKITSKGHETASGPLLNEFMLWFTPPHEPNVDDSLRRKAVTLAVHHMQPVAYYLNEVEEGINMNRAMGRLARRLYAGGVSMKLLALLSEADQRGRSKNNKFLTREETEVEVRQNWFLEKAKDVKIEDALPPKVLNGDIIMRELAIREGLVIGILIDIIFDDQLANPLFTAEEGLAKARYLIPKIESKVEEMLTIRELDNNWPKKVKTLRDKRFHVLSQIKEWQNLSDVFV